MGRPAVFFFIPREFTPSQHKTFALVIECLGNASSQKRFLSSWPKKRDSDVTGFMIQPSGTPWNSVHFEIHPGEKIPCTDRFVIHLSVDDFVRSRPFANDLGGFLVPHG